MGGGQSKVNFGLQPHRLVGRHIQSGGGDQTILNNIFTARSWDISCRREIVLNSDFDYYFVFTFCLGRFKLISFKCFLIFVTT